MQRRTFSRALAASITVWAHAAPTQQPRVMPWVVWLGINPLVPGESVVQDPFHEGFRDLGYIEGKNIVIEYRHCDGRPERLPELIGSLIRQKVDVFFVGESCARRVA